MVRVSSLLLLLGDWIATQLPSRFSGQLLNIVSLNNRTRSNLPAEFSIGPVAVDNRTVDAHFLVQIAGGHALCALAKTFSVTRGRRSLVPSMGVSNGSIRHTSSTPWLASTSPPGMTPSYRRRSARSCRGGRILSRGSQSRTWFTPGLRSSRCFLKRPSSLAFFENKVTGCCSVCFRLPAMLCPSSVSQYGMTTRGGRDVPLVSCPRLVLRDLISLGCHHTRRRFHQDGGP
jgi:hypothetical protein